MTFKNDYRSADRRLGRIPHWDPANEQFLLRHVLTPRPLVAKTWPLRGRLDQGQEGSCVGHGWAHRLNAAPHQRHLKHPDAVELYHEAQRLDPWPGESPDYEGTTVLAGAKAVKARGQITVYRWARTLDEILAALAFEGPVVAGTNWYEGMFEPDASGRLHVTGSIAGGHCWLLRGVDPDRKRVLMSNSWGPGWGRRGDADLTFTDLERLIGEDGAEFAVPTEN